VATADERISKLEAQVAKLLQYCVPVSEVDSRDLGKSRRSWG
jgi:hypothetical protein